MGWGMQDMKKSEATGKVAERLQEKPGKLAEIHRRIESDKVLTLEEVEAAIADDCTAKPVEVPAMQAVADVRFVVDVNFNEAVYIDGRLREFEGADGVVSIGTLGDLLDGRACVITNVSLADDFPSDINWPKLFDDLVPYIDTES